MVSTLCNRFIGVSRCFVHDFKKHSSSSPGLIYLKLAAIQTEKSTLYLCKSKFVWLETKMFKGEEQS